MKPLVIISNKHGICELPKDLRLTLKSRIIGGIGIIGEGGVDIVIIINNRGGWTGLQK